MKPPKYSFSSPQRFTLEWVVVLATAAISTLTCTANASQFLIASDYQGGMRRVDPVSGAILGTLPGGGGAGEIDLGPDGLIYASYYNDSIIREIDPVSGTWVRTIALPGNPRDVTFGPDGQLYIASTGDGWGHGAIGVFRYNLVSHQLSQFNTSTLNGTPIGIAFGPDNDLFVSLDARYAGNGTDSVVRIDGRSGNFDGVFTSTHISIPQSLAFGPNGNLYVGDQGTNQITEYSSDGSYLGIVTSSAGNPQGLYFLPDGDLLFGRGGYDFARITFPSESISSFSGGYTFAMGVVLVPEPGTTTLVVAAALCVLVVRRHRFKVRTWAGRRSRRSSPTMIRPAIVSPSRGRSPSSTRSCRSFIRFWSTTGRPPRSNATRRGGSSNACGTSTNSQASTRSSKTPYGPGSSRTRRCFCRWCIRRERPKSILARRRSGWRARRPRSRLFVMTLPYSGAIFIQVFPRECTETFLEGHRQAFEYFGGVPRRISYDNSAIAVIEVLAGRQRKLTKEFLRLQSHYLFQEHFCLVRRANEKGHVERLLGFARRNFLVPVPDVDSRESLNAQLLKHCQDDLAVRTRGKPGPKSQRSWKIRPPFYPCQSSHLRRGASCRLRPIRSRWCGSTRMIIRSLSSTHTAS